MINIAIVDDELNFVNLLSEKIIQICNSLGIEYLINKYFNGYDIIENYNMHHVIFLDIEMSPIDGISTAIKINELKNKYGVPYIVFITSHSELVFDALKSFPYSFIRKNYCDNDLYECLSYINNTIKFSTKTIMIHSDRKDMTLNVDEILYLEKIKNYVIYHNINQQYRVRSDIDSEFNKLSVFGFLRPHIGFVVKNSAISYISTDHISLVNGVDVPMNKKFREDIKQKYFRWLGEKDV